MRVKNGPLFYRMGLIPISILHYQRATFPNEPKSKLAEFTPIALNARIMVEKVTLFPLSILEICVLLPHQFPKLLLCTYRFKMRLVVSL